MANETIRLVSENWCNYIVQTKEFDNGERHCIFTHYDAENGDVTHKTETRFLNDDSMYYECKHQYGYDYVVKTEYIGSINEKIKYIYNKKGNLVYEEQLTIIRGIREKKYYAYDSKNKLVYWENNKGDAMDLTILQSIRQVIRGIFKNECRFIERVLEDTF